MSCETLAGSGQLPHLPHSKQNATKDEAGSVELGMLRLYPTVPTPTSLSKHGLCVIDVFFPESFKLSSMRGSSVFHDWMYHVP